MSGRTLDPLLRHVRRLAGTPAAGGLTDAELLERFIAGRDETAFEVLVWRHGGRVLGLCRRLLRHEQDAEDAFQATFLVLVRKASAISKRESVGSWLFKVAHRVALAARERAAGRAAHERPLIELPAAPIADHMETRELTSLLDEAVHRLPDKYRVPIVLCHFEGKTLAEAAQQLGCSRGTVGTRLARARERLRRQMAGRGLLLSSGALTLMLARTAAQAAVPLSLVGSTIRAAQMIAAGIPAAGTAVSCEVAALTKGVLHTMALSKLKAAAATVMTVFALSAGAGGLSYHMHAAERGGGQPFRPGAAEQTDDPDKAGTKGERLLLRGWGTAQDPEGDCKFTVEQGKLTISVPANEHSLDAERGVMNAPRVLQSVDGDFIIQVKVSVTFPTGTKSTILDRTPFFGAGLLLLKDDKTYIRLESAHMIAGDEELSYANWEIRKDGSWDRHGEATELPLKDRDVYLRMERHDDKAFASVSTDGVHWTSLEPIAVELPRRVSVGIAACHDTNTGYAPQFSEIKLFREAKK